MHRFLQAAGLSAFDTETKVYNFIRGEVINDAHRSAEVRNPDGSVEREYRYMFNEFIGLSVNVLYFDDGNGLLLRYYPFYNTYELSSSEICSVERHLAAETYAGLIDEYKIGLSLIFYVNNPMTYRMRPDCEKQYDFRGTYLTAFANSGTVLLPIAKNEEDLDESIREGAEKERLFEAARNGDEEAMETLTMSDLDMFQSINLRMENEDLYSVVEQSLMPSGIECDQYSVIGEITGVSENVNYRTNEELWLISLSCNSVEFNLCIRKDDLLGEPLPGRRLKCRIWLTGRVDFTNPVLPGDPDADAV